MQRCAMSSTLGDRLLLDDGLIELERGLIETTSIVLLTKGRRIGQSGGTNCLEILQVKHSKEK